MNCELEVAAIRRYLLESAGAKSLGAEITTETKLLDSGYLDSLGVVQMMVFLGETLHVEVADEDFTPENFDTVSSLARFVAAKRAQQLAA